MKLQFIEMFDIALELETECIFVEINAVDAKEVIVLPRESFAFKKEFYQNAYNNDLVHVMNEKVRITAFSHGSVDELRNHI